MATWAQAWEAIQLHDKAAHRELWDQQQKTYWVASEGPGCRAYLYEDFRQLNPYQPTVEDVTATDWVIFGKEN